MERLTAAKAKGWDALATGDIFLSEEFRLDGQGDGLSRRDKHVSSFQYPSASELSIFSLFWSSSPAVSSQKKRSWRRSGAGLLSRMPI